jgi:hypothetical protein
MLRLEFLKNAILGATGVGLLEEIVIKSKSIKIYHNYIRGLVYYDYMLVHEELKIDDRLTLKREPKNEYDKYAIEVYFEDKKLGYLPKTENKVIANLLDSGKDVFAIVQKIDSDKSETYRGLFVHVMMND